MLLTLAAVTTWDQALAEHVEASTDPEVDVADAEHAEQTTGVLPALCAPTAKEDLVHLFLVRDAIPAAALVSLSPVHLAPL